MVTIIIVMIVIVIVISTIIIAIIVTSISILCRSRWRSAEFVAPTRNMGSVNAELDLLMLTGG